MKWPKCKYGENCKYIHPEIPCKDGNKCPFGGDMCFYKHDACPHGYNCKRPRCPLFHPEGKKTQKQLLQPPLLPPMPIQYFMIPQGPPPTMPGMGFPCLNNGFQKSSKKPMQKLKPMTSLGYFGNK
jgi:Zinc finger C-x8-C-x5-C-x3-H type (and similar)